jgi:hypothetical protein
MITYLDNNPHQLLARVRPAGPPFRDQDGSLVGLDYTDYTGGGGCNVRLTIEQATALRNALDLYLTSDRKHEVVVAKTKHGQITPDI